MICAHCSTWRTDGECPDCGTYWRGGRGYKIAWPPTPVQALVAELGDKLGLRFKKRQIRPVSEEGERA
jgi:hypothetical protein